MHHVKGIAFAALMAAAFVCGATTAPEAHTPGHEMRAASAPATASQVALRLAMRKLWSDHVIWTREYVVAAIAGTPDAKAAATRLLRNQDDIGAAIVPYYGQQAGEKLTALLKDHILIAVDVVNAAKAGDQAGLQRANERWQQNANDVAAFLSAANPNWPRQALADAMAMHLETTTREAVARLNKDYAVDVQAFDAVFAHILAMADVLTDGIVAQFPARFAH